MGTATFWIIIGSAFLALVIVAFLIVALVKMKQRNDEIVSKVVKLEQTRVDDSSLHHDSKADLKLVPVAPSRPNRDVSPSPHLPHSSPNLKKEVIPARNQGSHLSMQTVPHQQTNIASEDSMQIMAGLGSLRKDSA